MERTDYYIIFDNFYELAEQYDADLANDLLNSVGEGEWQNEELIVYYDLEYFAEYELYEGFYAAEFGISGEPDFNGAPNPFNYIDLQGLGDALSESWDDSLYWTDGAEVVETSYGW